MRPLVFILMLFSFINLPAQDDRSIEKLSLEKINSIREEFNAKPLNRNARLDSAAAYQARWCAENNNLTHTRPSGRLRSVEDRIKYVKYKCDYSGENILYFMPDDDETEEEMAAELVQQWKDSPGHYANMRNKFYQDTGFAVAWSPDREKLYACQVFASPMKPKKKR